MRKSMLEAKSLQALEVLTPQASLSPTPKVFSCVLRPLSQLFSGYESPSPVALETTSRPALCSQHSRVFGLSIRRLPKRRQLAGRTKETFITVQQAVTRVQRWYKSILEQRRKALFESSCAVEIQRMWRGHSTRRRVAAVLRTRERMRGWVLGWKTRRIWRLRCVQRLVVKIKRAKPELQPTLKERFSEKLKSLWEGNWVHADTCLKIYASPSASSLHAPSSACKTEYSVSSTEASYSPFPRKPDLSLEDFLLCEQLASLPCSLPPPSVLPELGKNSEFVRQLQRVQRMETFQELRTLLEQERRILLG